ncbi:MAG: carboxypeptidase-like regulatory domain-containing protein, partial [Blastocatellia bacterium]
MLRRDLSILRKKLCSLLFALALSISIGGGASASSGSTLSGVVLDSSGASVGEASVSLLSAQQVTVAIARADSQGRFTL